MSCEISQDILYDCENPPVRGSKDRVIIIPRRSIVEGGITIDSSNHLIVTDIDIEIGDRAYEYVGNGMPLGVDKGMISDENGVRYRHRLPFKVYGDTPTIKKELESLSNETEGCVVIVVNNYLGDSGNAKYEILGKDAGVYVNLLEDTEGRHIHTIELSSKDGFEEPHMPANFFDSDIATTNAKVEALLEVSS